MLEKVAQRLAAWGYEVTRSQEGEAQTADEIAITFLISKTDKYIKNYCNIAEVPEELEESEIDMIAIDFLKQKAVSGGLDTTGLRVDGISSISEGDASVSYSSGSSVTLPAVYEQISDRFEADLLPFRRMRW